MSEQQYMARKYVSNKLVAFSTHFGVFSIWPFSSLLLRKLSEKEMEIMNQAERTGTLSETYKAVKEGKYVTRKERTKNSRTGKNAS
jgi:hypothetical protein